MAMRFIPSFSTDAELARAYAAFGKVASHWGPLEVIFEGLLLFIRNRQGITTIKNFPVTFSRVSDELVKRLRGEPMFAAHIVPVEAAIAEAKDLHELRVIVVHGICDGADPDGAIRFQKSKRREGFASRKYTLQIDAIERAASRMLDLAEELDPIYGDVAQRYLRTQDGALMTMSQREENGARQR